MSDTLELMEPAGPMLSMLCQGTINSVSFTSLCGVATLILPARSRTDVKLSVMPNGPKIFSRTRSSHGLPAAWAAACPAARYMMF